MVKSVVEISLDSVEDIDTLFQKNLRLVNSNIVGLTLENRTANKTQFIDTTFENCLFKNIQFENCHFRNSNFKNCRIEDCRFKRCVYNGFIFESSSNTYKIMSNSSFSYCSFIDITFKNKIEETRFEGCDYVSCNMSKIEIDECDFSEENMMGVNLRQSLLLDCVFFRTNLSRLSANGNMEKRTEFDRCIFEEANLSNANLQYVLFDYCGFNNTNFSQANLRRSAINNYHSDDDLDLSEALTDDLTIDGDDYDVFISSQELDEGFMEEADEDEYIEREGVAWEIHNAFHRINLTELVEYIRSTNPEKQSMHSDTTDSFLNDIYQLFGSVMNNWYKNNPDRRNELFDQLDKVLGQIECIDFDYHMRQINMPRWEFIQLVLSFVMAQDERFIRTYIKTFIKDSYEAYSSAEGEDANISCPKGIIERFVLSLHTASIILCPENFAACPSPYKELIRLLCSAVEVHIDWGKLQQEWYKSGVDKIPLDARKQNYIDYMKSRVDEICPIDEANNEKILKDADEWEAAELFSDENVQMFQDGGRVFLSNKYFI